MKNWTIGKRIVTGFASIIIIAVALGAFAYTRLVGISEQSDRIAKQSFPAIEIVYQVEKNAKDQVQLIYKHIGSSDKGDMARLVESMNAVSAENAKLYEELGKLVTDPNGRALLDKTQTARAENNRVRALVQGLSEQGSTNAQANAQAYSLGRSQFDPVNAQYITALEALVDFIKADANGASKNIQSAASSSKAGILIGLSLAIVVGLGIALIITRGTSRILRNVSHSLDEGSDQVVSASGQVSSASQTLAEGASEQASSLEETSSSLEEMSSMTKRNSENTLKANELAKEARAAADKGVGDMSTMATAMEAIKVSSDDIAKIIKTIDEIAFQTNILALNAAVEAARAGEAGMGFAVVADEVRNLAQRCAQAAKETSGKIEGAIAKSGQGVEITAKVAATLNEIVTKVRQVDELVTEVAGASREQTDGIVQINQAVGQMDKVTQSNAATAEESAAAAEELNAQAETMKQSVAELLKLVGGQSGAGTGRTAMPVRQPQTHFSKPPTRQPATSKGRNGAGNGHAVSAKVADQRRNEIPLEAEFKDF